MSAIKAVDRCHDIFACATPLCQLAPSSAGPPASAGAQSEMACAGNPPVRLAGDLRVLVYHVIAQHEDEYLQHLALQGRALVACLLEGAPA